jgi:hypothetical protein
MKVASKTGVSEIVQSVLAAVLPGNDVLGVERR